MSQGYVGEIRIFAGNFPPSGWMTCDGQLLPISEYDTLFNLIGTTYGGDGQNTFALPNLSGRVPVHQGTSRANTVYSMGQTGGVETVQLTQSQIPSHTHAIVADANAANTTQTTPVNNFYGQGSKKSYSAKSTNLHTMMTLGASGGSQPHDNLQPYTAVTYIISLFGVFPSPT